MAFTHIHFNDQNQYGRTLRRVTNQLQEFMQELQATRDTMLQMRDGDGSQAVHYAEVTTRYGFVSDAFSKQAFDELNSLYLKVTTNASVPDVNTAILNFIAKLSG